jgi:hypothetical protein
MNQSSFIAAMLLTLFVLFLAANNRLGVYTQILWGPANAQTAAAVSGGVSGAATGLSGALSGMGLGAIGAALGL